MPLTQDQKAAVIRQFPCFASIPEAEWHNGDIEFVRASAIAGMDRPHSAVHHAVFLLTGSARIYQSGDNGREITLYYVREGEFCLLMMMSLLGATEYGASAAFADSRSTVLIVSAERFQEWMDRYSDVRGYIFSEIRRRMMKVLKLVEDVAFRSMEQRMAEQLLLRSADGSEVIKTTHEELAMEVGTAREVVSRTLKTFEREGVISLGRGSIRILQRNELMNSLDPM